MICVHTVGKLIGNNYDVTGKPGTEDISWILVEVTDIKSYPH